MTRVRTAVWWLVAAAISSLLYLSYFESFPLPEFFQKAISLILVSLFLTGCWSIGRLIDARRLTPRAPWFRQVARCAMGAGVFGTLIVCSGLLFPSTLRTNLVVLLSGLATSVAVAGYRRFFGRLKIFESQRRFVLTPLQMGVWFVSALCIGFTFLTCFSPITYYDSLVYHLALPSIYLHQNSIAVVPYNLYSFFPGLMEMLYMFFLRFIPAPDYSINLFGFAISIGVSIVLAEWAYELAGRKATELVVLFWWSCPAVLLLSIGAYVDIPLAFWSLLALRSLDLWISNQDRSFVLAGGFFSGCAFATKYTGATVVGLLTIFFIFNAIRSKHNVSAVLVHFLLAAALAPLPWLIKNMLSVGNPVFPFAYQLLGSGDIWSQSSAANYFQLLTEYNHKSQIIDWLIRTPLLLFNRPLHFGGGFDVLGDFGWPLFLLSLPFFFVTQKLKPFRWIAAYAGSSLLIWYFSKPVLRFLIVVLPVLALLAAICTANFFDKERWKKSVAFFCVAPWLISNLFLYALFASDLKLFDVTIGGIGPDLFLSRRLSYYSAYSFINTELTAADKVFLIGEQRTYGLKRDFIACNLFATTPLAEVCNKASSDREILEYLKGNRVTYLLVSEPEIERLGGLNVFGFSETGKSQFQHFLAFHVQSVSNNQPVKLLRINY